MSVSKRKFLRQFEGELVIPLDLPTCAAVAEEYNRLHEPERPETADTIRHACHHIRKKLRDRMIEDPVIREAAGIAENQTRKSKRTSKAKLPNLRNVLRELSQARERITRIRRMIEIAYEAGYEVQLLHASLSAVLADEAELQQILSRCQHERREAA